MPTEYFQGLHQAGTIGKNATHFLPFDTVCVDLVGPIAPSTERGHRYILTLIDMASRYPDAVPLRDIHTETVADALLDMYSRIGIPRRIHSAEAASSPLNDGRS